MVKKITLDTLAAMTQRGFKEMGQHFDTVDQRFKAVDERFDRIDERFEKIDRKFEAVVSSIDLMQQDIKDIKITLGPLVRIVAALDSDVHKLNARVERLEKRAGLVKF